MALGQTADEALIRDISLLGHEGGNEGNGAFAIILVLGFAVGAWAGWIATMWFWFLYPVAALFAHFLDSSSVCKKTDARKRASRRSVSDRALEGTQRQIAELRARETAGK